MRNSENTLTVTHSNMKATIMGKKKPKQFKTNQIKTQEYQKNIYAT